MAYYVGSSIANTQCHVKFAQDTMIKVTRYNSLNLILLHFISLAFTLTVNVGQDQLEKGSIQDLITRQTESSAAIAVAHVGRFTVECSGQDDGTDLKVESCEDAYNGFPDSRKPYAFGPRGHDVDIHTPTRILSREYQQEI